MRFMVMHKVGPRMEAGQVEKSEIVNMGAFIKESMDAGVFTNGAGLRPSNTRTRVRFQGGKEELTEGPYTGRNELISAFALLKVADKAEALRWTRRFADILGDSEFELGPLTEPWDIGLMPKPEGPLPLNYAVFFKADAKSEANTPPSEKELTQVPALMQEMVKAGVLRATEGMLPSRDGTRLQFKGGTRVSAIDGPFAESKELIAGFSIISVPSKDAALAWADRYGSILQDLEVDVRKLYDEPAYQA